MSQVPIKPTIRFFVHEQLHYKWRLFGMFGSHPFALLFLNFLPPLIIANILERLSNQHFIKGDLWGSFGPQLLLAIGCEALGGILIWRIVIFCNWSLEAFVSRNIARKVFDHLLRLSASFHANHFGGSLVSQTNKLISAYISITDATLFQAMGLIWSLFFTSVLLAGKAPLFVLLLNLFAVAYVICAIIITRKVRKLKALESEAENEQTGQLADAITNVMAIKSFAAGPIENKRFNKVTEATRKTTRNLMHAQLKREVTFGVFSTSISGVAMVVAVASVVLFGTNVAVVFLVLNYTFNILVRLWEFSTQTLRAYNRAFGDAQGMIEVLATEPEVKDPTNPEKSRIDQGAITFNDVTFTHDGAKDDALFSGLTLAIKSSEKIGLVGHSGSGKTTLTRLLLRFSDIDAGAITIDGQNIAHMAQDDLRRSIAYVPQEPLLFHRSIKENIAYGKPSATDAEIREAARKAYAADFIEKLPDGYGTLVGERGVKLSGGQRQRIAIARAILKNAPILVLDEATSALDSESEKLIQAALWQLMEGRTAIVIAHRLSTVQKMDRIIVLDNGTITEEGTHKELIAEPNGTYAKLWAHQSGGFLEDV
ncbi:MAG TPA: ABC transporter ATP-binding protein [Candidatus Saccharimonadales bacterium]|nr:ABC transporter ATP-binding protein [Candidatus Saccharimonadales bacterium]